MSLPDKFEVHGHRGARGLKPENTLPGFETALDLGVDALELDLHLSADAHVVVWHDPYVLPSRCGIDPAAAAPLPPDPDALPANTPALRIRSLSCDQVARYCCNRNPDPNAYPTQSSASTALAGSDYRIITLDELFDFVEAYAKSPLKTEPQRQKAASIQYNLELKRDRAHPEYIDDGFDGKHAALFERQILEGVRRRGLIKRVVAQSFDHRALWALHQLEPALTVCALTDDSAVDLELFAARGATSWSPLFTTLREEQVRAAHAVGLKVIPWTVNADQDMQRLIAMGVDGLITDYPNVLLRSLGR